MKRFLFALLLGGLLIPCLVLAQTYTVIGIELDEPDYYPAGQDSIVNLTITNNDVESWFTLSIVGIPSSWLEPEQSIVRIEQGDIRVIPIHVNVPKDADPGHYAYDITVTRSGDGTKLKDQIVVNAVQRVEALISNLKTSCFQCEEDVTVSGTVKNIGTNSVPLVVNIAFGSDFKMIDMGTVAPSGEKKFVETINIEDYQPGEYELTIDLMTDDRKVYTDTNIFNIITQKNISYIEDITMTPIGRFVALRATNYGNSEDTAVMTVERNNGWWSYYVGEDPTSMTDSDYIWTQELASEESITVTFYDIYWPVIVGVILLIIVGIYYYLQMTTIGLRKTARTHKMSKGHEIPVSLIVKNNKIVMDSVVIRDIVPHGFSVAGKFDTLKPVVRKIAEGTELVWRIGKLRSGEERVLHYKIKPSKEHYGDLDLPLAAVRAKHDDKSIIKHSNVVELHGKIKEAKKHKIKVE